MNEVAMNHINDVLGVESVPLIDERTTSLAIIDETPKPLAVIEQEDTQAEFKEDFDQARNVLKRILEKTEDSFDELIEIAKMAESPRAFEVVSSTAKTMADVAKQLVDLHDSRKSPTQNAETKIGNVQNMMVTTSEDLIKALKGNG